MQARFRKITEWNESDAPRQKRGNASHFPRKKKNPRFPRSLDGKISSARDAGLLRIFERIFSRRETTKAISYENSRKNSKSEKFIYRAACNVRIKYSRRRISMAKKKAAKKKKR
jgi:hypothetical protein